MGKRLVTALFLIAASTVGPFHAAHGEEYLASLYLGDDIQGAQKGYVLKSGLPCGGCLTAKLDVEPQSGGPAQGGLFEVSGGAASSGDGPLVFKGGQGPFPSEAGGATPLLGFLFMLGVHELGHLIEADYSGVPVEWSGGKLVAYTDDREKLARLAGAGLVFQNLLGGMGSFLPVESGLARSIRVASALNRLGYVAFPESILGDGGDVNTMDDTKRGGDFLKGALAISALADLYKAFKPDDRWDINFWQSPTGTPGLEFVYRL